MCSKWLASLDPSMTSVSLPVWVLPGTFSFPRQPHSPVIMIGPGTGCAPFRAFLEERTSQRKSGEWGDGRRQPLSSFYHCTVQPTCCSLAAVLQLQTSSLAMSGQLWLRQGSSPFIQPSPETRAIKYNIVWAVVNSYIHIVCVCRCTYSTAFSRRGGRCGFGCITGRLTSTLQGESFGLRV